MCNLHLTWYMSKLWSRKTLALRYPVLLMPNGFFFFGARSPEADLRQQQQMMKARIATHAPKPITVMDIVNVTGKERHESSMIHWASTIEDLFCFAWFWKFGTDVRTCEKSNHCWPWLWTIVDQQNINNDPLCQP